MQFELTIPSADELCQPARRSGRRKKAVRGPIVAELPIEKIVAVIDTREQLPHDLAPLAMVTDTLKAGDYSVRGLENIIAIERKSLPDFLACVGRERERFEACVQRLLAYPTRAIVIEASWEELEAAEWLSRIAPAAAIAAVTSWMTRGVPVILSGDRRRAASRIREMLILAARQRWRECRKLIVSAEQMECE